MTFASLGLSPKVLSAVETAGYTEPTPIQSEAIPYVLQRRDVIGIAQTGTGKTASFTLPMLSILEKGRPRARMPRTLVLEPTRELAAQVAENLSRYGVNHKMTVVLLIGGVSFDEQDKKLDRGADIVIATPGRLLDHFERGKLLLQGVEILVIDEADRMLDMGFIPDIERISSLIPMTRQTLFFSATMAPEIQRLTDAFLHNPVRVEVSPPTSTAENVKQTLVAAPREDHGKREVLREQLRKAVDLQNAIIFCNRKRDVSLLYKSLEKHGFPVGALHGDMDQHSRTAMLDNFRKGNIPILVASDVAARGLDIPAVSHIFNFDVPNNAEDYIHRIGRTGRAGRSGTAITLVGAKDRVYLDAVESLIGTKLEWAGESVFDRSSSSAAAEPAPRRSSRGQATRKASSERPRRTTERSGGEAREERPAPRESRGSESRNDGNRKSSRRGNETDAPVVGMGDHVPDFMRIPVPVEKPKKTPVA